MESNEKQQRVIKDSWCVPACTYIVIKDIVVRHASVVVRLVHGSLLPAQRKVNLDNDVQLRLSKHKSMSVF